MKSHDNELYEDWCERARQYEVNIAYQNLKKGLSVEQVLDKLSQRLLNKYMDPLYALAKKEVDLEYDREKSKAEYQKIYLDKVNPVPDHVVHEN